MYFQMIMNRFVQWTAKNEESVTQNLSYEVERDGRDLENLVDKLFTFHLV